MRKGAGQIIAQGHAASQSVITQQGTGAGGFFAVNLAQPPENPTTVSEVVQSVSILLLPMAFCFLVGRMVDDRRQGWVIFRAMGVLFIADLQLIDTPEQVANLSLTQATGINRPHHARQKGPLWHHPVDPLGTGD